MKTGVHAVFDQCVQLICVFHLCKLLHDEILLFGGHVFAGDSERKHMTAEEQNFVMQKLAQMEDANKLDALIEYGVNACFHIFIYDDGNPPKL